MRTKVPSARLAALLFVTLALVACVEPQHLTNAPNDLDESDLAGTWVADYGYYGGKDTLVLRDNGTFKQIYESKVDSYIYVTSWNEWSLQRFADGRVWLHLRGARYYRSGIPLAEEEGVRKTALSPRGEPIGFFDPWDPGRVRTGPHGEIWPAVHMVGELVLNARVLPSEALVLAHLWSTTEWGFGDKDLFHRIDMPTTLVPLAEAR